MTWASRYGHYGVLTTLVEFGLAAQEWIGCRLDIDRSDMVTVLGEERL